MDYPGFRRPDQRPDDLGSENDLSPNEAVDDYDIDHDSDCWRRADD